MHSPMANVDQTNSVRRRCRRGKVRFTSMMRGVVVGAAMLGITAVVLWLKRETPHPELVSASRESPLVEARSLKPLLETAKSSELSAYAMKKADLPTTTQNSASSNHSLPVWLASETEGTSHRELSSSQAVEWLKQKLRERGAQKMASSVRFAMLNVAELLAMDSQTWKASMATPAANENHASAMLLTFYLHHLDRAGDAAGLAAMLQALSNGISQEQAVREFVLAGRSLVEFEGEMGQAFGNIGVELQFTRRGGAVFRP